MEINMIRKIYKSGNSLVVSLPKKYLNVLKLNIGSEVLVIMEKGCVTIKPVDQYDSFSMVDDEFSAQLAEFIEQYRPALEVLSREK
jgi:putative addiction module antidote